MNVEHRIMYSTIYNKDTATRPPRLSEPTKGRRALSTTRDGGQERLPHSTFLPRETFFLFNWGDVERSMFDVRRSSFICSQDVDSSLKYVESEFTIGKKP